mgnify:CR=1 FL=1
MATLTKHTTFKSLKQSSSVKVKKNANPKKNEKVKMEAFLQLLSNTKAKKA